MRLWPFAWAFGLGSGAALAAVVGVYGPPWDIAVVFPLVTAIFAIGGLFEDDEPEHITNVLRFCVGVTIGFTFLTIPINLYHLIDIIERNDGDREVISRASRLSVQLWQRWGVISLAEPIGAVALAVRLVRRARRPRARTDAA